MSKLYKKMLFTYLLSEIDTSKYKEKKLKEKIKSIHDNIFDKKIKTKTVKFSDIMKHPNLSLSPKDYIK